MAMPMPVATATQEKYWMASGLATPSAAKTTDANARTKNTENPENHTNLFIQSSTKVILIVALKIQPQAILPVMGCRGQYRLQRNGKKKGGPDKARPCFFCIFFVNAAD
jgi:hypothetical protein